MKSHEIKMASLAFGEHSEDIKPVIPVGASDTAALDAVFEAICRAGRDAPTAYLMLVPDARQENHALPGSHQAIERYLDFGSESCRASERQYGSRSGVAVSVKNKLTVRCFYVR